MKVLGTFTTISLAVGAAVDRTPTALELRARRLALKTGQDIPNPDQIDYIINAYNVGVAKNTLHSVTDPMTTMFIVLCEIASGKSVSSDPCREYIEGDKVGQAKEELKKLLVLASKIRLAVATEPKVVPRPTSVHGGSMPIADDKSPASTHGAADGIAGGSVVEADVAGASAASFPAERVPTLIDPTFMHFPHHDEDESDGDGLSSSEGDYESVHGLRDSDLDGLDTETNDPPGPAAASRGVASGAKSPSAAETVAAGAGGRRSLLATLSERGIDTFTKSPDPQRDSAKAGGDASVAGKDGSTKVLGAGVFFEDGVFGYRFQNGNTFGVPLFDRFWMDRATAERVGDELGGEGGDE